MPHPTRSAPPAARRLAAVLLGALALASTVAPPVGWTAGGPQRAAPGVVAVTGALDGDTLELADGRVLRLAGVLAPRPPQGREDERAWPLARAATAALSALASGHGLRLPDDAVTDRHGRLMVQAVRDDGLWLQGEMLRQGWVRVLTRPDARDRAAEMLAIEAEARHAGRGVWGSAAFSVRPAVPEGLRGDRHTVQVVEGPVVAAAAAGGWVYLNFGADWRTDVTARIGRDALKRFQAAGLDPLALEGAVVRVRGWIGDYNGPIIEVTHPEQIERVGTAAPPASPPAARSPEGDAGDGDAADGDAWEVEED